MGITAKQKTRIDRYLRDVGSGLGSLSDADREDALARLGGRIQREVRARGDDVTDQDVDAVLKACGRPAQVAAKLQAAQTPRQLGWIAWDDRMWLGVCSGIARRLELQPIVVRLLAVVVGLIVPLLPLLLIAYVAAFLLAYFQQDEDPVEPIDPIRVVKSVGLALAIALGLHYLVALMLAAMSLGYRQLTGEPMTYAPGYGDILQQGGEFMWLLCVVVPLAAIAALPAPKTWAGTLTKVWQAMLALYGVWLCYGVAKLVAGIAIHTAETVAGSGSGESAVSFMEQLESLLR